MRLEVGMKERRMKLNYPFSLPQAFSSPRDFLMATLDSKLTSSSLASSLHNFAQIPVKVD
jgi:hypothetical protein